jgi:hypothetical protein
MNNTIFTNEALEAAKAVRATARPNAEAAAATWTRAERLSADAADNAAEIEQELTKLEAAQAKRLEAAIAAGGPTSAVTTDIDAKALAAELAAAKFHAAVSSRALASLKAAHDTAQAELRSAEAAVLNEVNEILDREQLETAKQLVALLDQAVTLGKALLFEAIADEMGARRKPPEFIADVLSRLDFPILDRCRVATNLWKEGDKDALARRAARRASMLADESAPVDETAAA